VLRKLVSGFAVVALLVAGCGQAQSSQSSQSIPSPKRASDPRSAQSRSPAAPALHAHPQAIEPVAGAVAQSGPPAQAPASVSVGGGSSGLAQPVSDAQIRKELAASGLSASASQATLTPARLAIAPVNAPTAVQDVMSAGNQIAHLPYRFGGGHGTFEDNAYDCSGSLSFVFAAAGLLNTTVTSGQLMSGGKPGPGKWITVFAAPGHTFMYVAGLRFDTVALAETGSRWSNRSADESDLSSFVVRHPAGL
jgi:cell wall-associated NlpC family hydrolase